MIKTLGKQDRKNLLTNVIEEIKSNKERYKYYAWNLSAPEDLERQKESDLIYIKEYVSMSGPYINGLFGYVHDVVNEKITGIYLLCFEDNNYTFMKDFKNFTEAIYKTFSRIEIEVIPGSLSYSIGKKLFKKYEFEKIGVKRKSVKLLDNKFYDVEIWQRVRG